MGLIALCRCGHTREQHYEGHHDIYVDGKKGWTSKNTDACFGHTPEGMICLCEHYVEPLPTPDPLPVPRGPLPPCIRDRVRAQYQ